MKRAIFSPSHLINFMHQYVSEMSSIVIIVITYTHSTLKISREFYLFVNYTAYTTYRHVYNEINFVCTFI